MSEPLTPATGEPGEIYWRYEVPENRGATMLLLTRGRTAFRGSWTGELGEFYIAWSPLPRRDKRREDELIAAGRIPII